MKKLDNPVKILTHFIDLLKKKRISDLKGEDTCYRFAVNEKYGPLLREMIKTQGKYSIYFSDILLWEFHKEVQWVDDFHRLECGVWRFIIKMNSRPLPEKLGIQLCSYKNCQLADVLANSEQHLSVYFCAADLSKYARSRLCIRLFVNEKYGVEDLEKFIGLYGKSSALRILTARKPSDDSKYAVFSVFEQSRLKEHYSNEESPERKKKMRKNKKRGSYIRERIKEEKKIYGRGHPPLGD